MELVKPVKAVMSANPVMYVKDVMFPAMYAIVVKHAMPVSFVLHV